MTLEWIKNLKPGDKVVAVYKHRSQVVIVKRNYTNTISLCGVVQVFSKEDGYSTTNTLWDSVRIIEATPENLAMAEDYARREVATNAIRGKLYGTYAEFSTEQLERIAAILKEEK